MALFTQNTEGFRVFNNRKIRYQWCCFLFIYLFFLYGNINGQLIDRYTLKT